MWCLKNTSTSTQVTFWYSICTFTQVWVSSTLYISAWTSYIYHKQPFLAYRNWLVFVVANAPSRRRRFRNTVPIECVAGAGKTPVQRDLVPIISKTEQTAGKVATLRLCCECHLLLIVGRRWGIGGRWEKTFVFVHCSICICVVNIHVVVRNVLWKRWLVNFIVVCLI